MPLYEYRCSGCQKRTELLVLAGDVASTPVCPSCGGHDMNRLLSTFAAQGGEGKGSSKGFDADTACGGGACRMPDVCGAGDGDFGGGADFGDFD
jgi:putative FmdB family regulatory protein